MNTPTIETKRLILRKFTENDLDALYEIYSDEAVNTFLPWFPLKTTEEAKTFRMYQLNLDGNGDRVYNKYWDTSAVHFIETAANL